MCGSIKISICREDAEMVEVIRRSAVIPNGVLKLPKIVECGDLLQVDLRFKERVRTYIHKLNEQVSRLLV